MKTRFGPLNENLENHDAKIYQTLMHRKGPCLPIYSFCSISERRIRCQVIFSVMLPSQRDRAYSLQPNGGVCRIKRNKWIISSAILFYARSNCHFSPTLIKLTAINCAMKLKRRFMKKTHNICVSLCCIIGAN